MEELLKELLIFHGGKHIDWSIATYYFICLLEYSQFDLLLLPTNLAFYSIFHFVSRLSNRSIGQTSLGGHFET